MIQHEVVNPYRDIQFYTATSAWAVIDSDRPTFQKLIGPFNSLKVAMLVRDRLEELKQKTRTAAA